MTIIDVAGGTTGGAARWRREAQTWITGDRRAVRLVGIGRHVEPTWLVRREVIRSSGTRIAANNVSFVTGSQRVVLLRNHLHFLAPGERASFPDLPRNIDRQVKIVRTAVRLADVVVVPSSQMAERVVTAVPGVRNRIHVRLHPVTPGRPRSSLPEPYILFPSIPSPHKDLRASLSRLTDALRHSNLEWRVLVTADRDAVGACIDPAIVESIGTQSLEQMDDLLARAGALFAPYLAESFGYPAAEGRAMGIPVIAPDTPHNREVGGAALCGYEESGGCEKMAEAVEAASCKVVFPDPAPFDAFSYFSWLTSL